MKVIRRDLVFQDLKNIYPGEKWEDKILNAIDRENWLYIFYWYIFKKFKNNQED